MVMESAVISSPYRKEIEEMIIEGKSGRKISEWLKEHGESISHTAINKYKKNDFNIQAEAVKKFNEIQSRKRKENGIDKTVSTLELCSKIKGEAYNRDLTEISTPEILKDALQAGKLQHDIEKAGDPIEIELKGDVSLNVSVQDRIKQYEKEFKQMDAPPESSDSGDGV